MQEKNKVLYIHVNIAVRPERPSSGAPRSFPQSHPAVVPQIPRSQYKPPYCSFSVTAALQQWPCLLINDEWGVTVPWGSPPLGQDGAKWHSGDENRLKQTPENGPTAGNKPKYVSLWEMLQTESRSVSRCLTFNNSSITSDFTGRSKLTSPSSVESCLSDKNNAQT